MTLLEPPPKKTPGHPQPPNTHTASSQSFQLGSLLRTLLGPSATRYDRSEYQEIPKPSLSRLIPRTQLPVLRFSSPVWSAQRRLCPAPHTPRVSARHLRLSPSGSRPFPLPNTCSSARAFPCVHRPRTLIGRLAGGT